MTKLFHRLSTRIVLEILLAVAVSAAIYAGANAALTRFFQQYATEPAVFRRLSDRHFQDLQRFAQENHLVSTDGKPFTQWNDRYHYVSLMVIRQNEALCYNSFVSYNMTYTEEDQEHFYWGSKVLPTYEYRLRLADETCKVYFSGYFDQAYTSLRKGICAGLFLISFVAGFYLLFQKHIRYIEEMEQNVSSLCSKNFSRQIPIRGSTELSTLAANINHLGDTIQLLLLTEDAKLKQKEQFVKSIAHDIRTHDVSLAVHDICSGIGGNIRNEVLVEIALRIRRDIVIGHALFLQNLLNLLQQRLLPVAALQQHLCPAGRKPPLLRQGRQMHPRQHAVLPRRRQNPLVPQGYRLPLRPDAVGKGGHIGQVRQLLAQQVAVYEGVGVPVHPQGPGLATIPEGDHQLLPRLQAPLSL